MLKRENRLAARRDFDTLFKRGRATFGANFVVKAARRPGEGVCRVAFVVGTKVSKDAVVRNRLRRRMREVVRLVFAGMSPGFDVMVSAKGVAAGRLEYAAVADEVLALLRKAGVLAA